jgi:hypothetical protein
MPAVPGAGFAAGPFAVVLGRAFGKGGGLAFGGAFGVSEASLEVGDGSLELLERALLLGQLVAESLVVVEQFLVRGCGHPHPNSAQQGHLPSIVENQPAVGQGTLNKYDCSS